MKFLWVTDPWSKLDRSSDTTLRLINESLARGNHNYVCDSNDVQFIGSDTKIKSSEVHLKKLDPYKTSFVFKPPIYRKPSIFDLILLRADPPITTAYADLIRLLTISLRKSGKDPETCIVNPPATVLMHSAKLLPLILRDFPRSIVSNSVSELIEFTEQEQFAVLKPLHRFAGAGIRLVSNKMGKAELQTTFKTLTKNGRQYLLAQRYLKNYFDTEKRVLFVDGFIVEACLKRFQKGSFPPRFRRIEPLFPTTLNSSEKLACLRLGAFLRAFNIRIAGVDLIDGLITDVNIISPGLLVEMEQATGRNLAASILSHLEGSQK